MGQQRTPWLRAQAEVASVELAGVIVAARTGSLGELNMKTGYTLRLGLEACGQ